MPTRYNPEEITKMAEMSFSNMLTKTDFERYKKALSRMIDFKAYSEQHDEYKNVFLLNGYKIPKYLYRYISYKSFVLYVESNTLEFVSPILWPDPFEFRFFNTDYSAYNYIRPEIACMCTTENTRENEDAAWKIYINNQKDKGLRVKLNITKLLSQLNKLAIENNFYIYIGKINYDFERDEIEKLHTEKNPFFKNQFFTHPFTDDNYLTLMSLKRKSFHYENETRIFLVKKKELYDTNKVVVPLKMDIKEVIESVVIAPLPPFEYSDPRKEEYDKMYEIERRSFYKRIKELLPSCRVYSSLLYRCDQLEKA